MIFDQNYFSKLILESFNLLFQLIKVPIFRSSNFWIKSRASKNGQISIEAGSRAAPRDILLVILQIFKNKVLKSK